MMMRLLIAAVFLLLAPLPADAAELKPHVVTFAPRLVGAPAGLALDGQMALSYTIRCKVWAVKHTSSIAIQARGKPLIAMVIVEQGEESRDGTNMAYSSLMSLHGNRIAIKAAGKVAGKGKSGTVEVQAGNAKRIIEIPDGAFLPVAAWERVVDELMAGRKAFALREYEASYAHGVVDVSYQIVNSPFGNAALPSDPDGLLAGPSWIVAARMSLDGQVAEQIFQLHRSGVISRVLQTVNNATIEFTATSVQAAPEIGC